MIILLFTVSGVNNSNWVQAQSVSSNIYKEDLSISILKVKHTDNNNTNGEIHFQVKGGYGEYSLKLLGPGLKDLNPDPTEKITLQNLAKGTYTIAVEDELFNFSYKSIEVK